MLIRPAEPEDSVQMSEILMAILESWDSDRPRSPAHVLSNYIAHPDKIRCSLAQAEDGVLLGFQSLKRAAPGNPYGLPRGWGIIGTYVSKAAGRRGVGKALFAASLEAARADGIEQIEAAIGADNHVAQKYYAALGFERYNTRPGVVCKRYHIT